MTTSTLPSRFNTELALTGISHDLLTRVRGDLGMRLLFKGLGPDERHEASQAFDLLNEADALVKDAQLRLKAAVLAQREGR